MHAAADRPEFTPPPPPGFLRAVVLAVIAHLLLLAALTWGVNWKHDAENIAAEAELWSAVPQQAAPRLQEAPKPPPAPAVKPAPPPKPAVAPQRDADIALEREKKQKAEAKAKQDELARLKKIEQQKLEAAKKLEAQKKLELAKKAEDDKKKQQADTAKTKVAQQQEETKKLEALRQENLKRMAGLAGATGGPASTGSAQRASGPSDSYGSRIKARVRPNIVFTDDNPSNAAAEVEVRQTPDGTITSRKIVKSSGSKTWDEAVLRALDKTEVLPRDIDGRVHSPLIITFRPRD